MKFAISAILLLSCMVLGTRAAGKARSMCPEGWFFYPSSCYGYFTERLTWGEAEVECASYGGHLVSIHNNRESDIISNQLSAFSTKVNVWTGGNDPKENQRWKWTDGSIFNYKKWNNGEPNNVGSLEHCIELLQEHDFKKWNDIRCDTKNHYICKYKL